MKTQIYNLDYNDYISLIGTVHFTTRSFHEASQVVKRLQPTDLAIELDLNRFKTLNTSCWACYRRGMCRAKCEFIGATEALGNVDANIWLIDISEHEISQRIYRLATLTSRAKATWRVLINERDTIMAARLAWIASKALREDGKPNILGFVGAAHVEGIKNLLSSPSIIKENLQKLNLTFTQPSLIRRISVNPD